MEGANNHYNCPIVTSYAENIKNNMEELRDPNVLFMNPFLALDNADALKVRLYDELSKHFDVTKEEIDEAYEENTGHLIVNEFKRMGKDVKAVPAVLCKNHGPFTWGKDAHEAVHNAVVLEEVAKMAYRAETINPRIQPAPQELQDKHYYRKHGVNAYYGQN